MSLEENGSGIPATMLVGPTGYNNGGNTGFGDGNGWWIILLFILMLMGGWNRGGYGGGDGGGDGGPENGYGYVQQGFGQASVMNGITGIQNGVNALGMQVCNGFGQAEIAANARQMADMNQMFGFQTAVGQGFNSLQAQLAQCCCENRLATQQLQAVVQQENCADRAAVADGIRDIIANQNAGIQSIKDQLCQDKIDAKNDEIAQLRQELLYARGQSSLDVQTATIRAGQAATAQQVLQEARSCPIPSMPVYGMTPIFSCSQNQNPGCGCGAFAN